MKQILFHFTFDDAKITDIIHQSLLPELPNDILQTTIKLKKNKNILEVQIIGENISSIRAACNSYLRWIETAASVTYSH